MPIWEKYSDLQEKIHELDKYVDELSGSALIDYKTGLYTRRYIDERIDEEIKRAERYQHFLSLVVIHFDSNFNLSKKTQKKDSLQVTQKLSSLLKDRMRRMDVAFRYDDNKFFVLLPETDSEGGQLVANRLKNDFEEFLYQGPVSSEKAIAVGVGTYPSDARTGKELIDKVVIGAKPG